MVIPKPACVQASQPSYVKAELCIFHIVRYNVQDWDLHIIHARLSDSGTYQCEVNTRPVKTREIRLMVVKENGRWSAWGMWSECNKACGDGERKRKRSCVDRQFGGKACEGSKFDKEKCNMKPCRETDLAETKTNALLDKMVNPFLKWLKSGTRLNDAQRKLAIEQTQVAKLTRKQLQLDINRLERDAL